MLAFWRSQKPNHDRVKVELFYESVQYKIKSYESVLLINCKKILSASFKYLSKEAFSY